MLLFKLLLVFCVWQLSSQLGKSDRKKKKIVEEEEQVPEMTREETELFESLRFAPESVTKQSILKENSKVDKGEERHFGGAALAYITPWNNKGYDLAKSTSQKLTHIAPVWLQLKPQTADHSFSCRIEGAHDIDHDWLEEIRAPNRDLKVVPRVIFEEWSVEQMFTMISHEQWSKRCMDDLINFLTRNQFDGAVLELWMDVMHRTRGEAAPMLVEFLNSWGDAFSAKNMQVIVPVGPPVDQNNQLTGYFTPAHLHAMAPHIDYVQLMTYDYPSESASAVAPFDWVEGSIEGLLEGSNLLADKLMIGINHYGYKYSKKGMEAVKYDQYLDLLKRKGSELEWDAISREHFVKVDGSTTYYPSLTSIELRLKLAAKHGVGIAIWDYGQGLDYFSQLL